VESRQRARTAETAPAGTPAERRVEQIDEIEEQRAALEQFKRRVDEIGAEVGAIDRELARRDIMALSHRTREAVRVTRDLLDRNVDVLFAGQADRTHHDLYAELEYAEGHVSKALSEETEFQAMEQRIYLAAHLAQDVLDYILEAVHDMEARLEGVDGTDAPV
jgi:hypothetical protein